MFIIAAFERRNIKCFEKMRTVEPIFDNDPHNNKFMVNPSNTNTLINNYFKQNECKAHGTNEKPPNTCRISDTRNNKARLDDVSARFIWCQRHLSRQEINKTHLCLLWADFIFECFWAILEADETSYRSELQEKSTGVS